MLVTFFRVSLDLSDPAFAVSIITCQAAKFSIASTLNLVNALYLAFSVGFQGFVNIEGEY